MGGTFEIGPIGGVNRRKKVMILVGLGWGMYYALGDDRSTLRG